MICTSVYLLVFIQNLLMHLAEKILLTQPHTFRGDDPRRSAIDGRTACRLGYAVSQERRKEIEGPFGRAKTVGPIAQTMLRGTERLGAQFTMTMAACNLARLPKLRAT